MVTFHWVTEYRNMVSMSDERFDEMKKVVEKSLALVSAMRLSKAERLLDLRSETKFEELSQAINVYYKLDNLSLIKRQA